MPSFFRFLTIVVLVLGVVYAGLWASAVYLEPVPRDVAKPVYGVSIRN